ncbi:MAG: hypothetical protein J6N76_01475 [Lachnospiraceae bacterium]|nr:hypothetical protein [Lachnospiraceae bacterium]
MEYMNGAEASLEEGISKGIKDPTAEESSANEMEPIRRGLHEISEDVIDCGRLILECINSRGSDNPLVQLYPNMGREELETILAEGFKSSGKQLTIRNSLSIASMPEELLNKILDHNEVKGIQRVKTMDFYHYMIRHASERLFSVPHFDIIPRLERRVFEERPLALDLDEDEISRRLYYTYDEYMEHLSFYEKYVEENDNLTAVYADHLDYPELTIRVRCRECVIITRSCEPKMNLVVSEPHICDLFEQYISRKLLGR